MIDWIIVAARFLQFTAALILFGSSLFYLYALNAGPGAPGSPVGRWLRRTLFGASIAALLATLAWTMAEIASLTGVGADAFNPSAVWSLLTETGFGHVYLVRLALLLVSLLLFGILPLGRAIWIAQAALGAIIVSSFAWSGHGVFNSGWANVIHRGGDVLHLLAAAFWIGALLPLAVLTANPIRTLRGGNAPLVLYALDKFSGVGMLVVAILVATGLINSWYLIGVDHWRGLFVTPYGLVLLAKLALFGLMLLLAAANRYRLTPALSAALSGGSPAMPPDIILTAVRSLRTSLVAETTLGTAVLAAVALLGTLEPPISGT